MKYLPLILLIAGFLLTASYALKANEIKDYILGWTARMHGSDSTLFRMQRSFVDNAAYVMSFRIVAGAISILLLAAIVYLLVVSP